jgi:hypothetical protein
MPAPSSSVADKPQHTKPFPLPQEKPMSQPDHILLIDIEHYGLTPPSPLIAIAACAVPLHPDADDTAWLWRIHQLSDLDPDHTLLVRVDAAHQMQHGTQPSIETLIWWERQSRGWLDALDPIHPQLTCAQLAAFIARYQPLRIYARGSDHERDHLQKFYDTNAPQLRIKNLFARQSWLDIRTCEQLCPPSARSAARSARTHHPLSDLHADWPFICHYEGLIAAAAERWDCEEKPC